MSMFRRLLARLGRSLWQGRTGVDVSREIATHLQMLEEDLARRGLSRDEARAEARRRFGSAALAADQHRDTRGFAWVDDLRWDIRYAARLLARNPAFALTAILSLAIGIGANTTVFTIAHALLFRDPAGVTHPERLVDIGSSRNGRGFSTISYPTYIDVRDRASTLDGVYAYPLFPEAMSLTDATATTGSGGVERIFGSVVSANYFAVLGAAPARGQLFRPEADESAPVVVLSHRFWMRRFNGDAAIVGKALTINGQPFVVSGVAAERFQGTGVFAEDVWMPLTAPRAVDRAMLTNRGAVWLNAGGRLRSGVSVTQASAELDAIGRSLVREHPDLQNPDVTLRAIAPSPLPGAGGPVAALLALLIGIVGVVLLIACANLAGVLLARAAARRREIAVRLAIGAGRRRLIRQLLVETLLLFAIGGGAALVVARIATSLLVSMMPALSVPIDISLALDGFGIVFTAGLACAAALLSGLAPALHTSKADVVSALKDETPFASRHGLRHAFVVAQVACSVLLVVVAGLFARALQKVESTSPGFDAHGLELAAVNFSLAGYTDTTAPLFARELITRVRALPAVQEATIAFVLPGGFERLGLGGIAAADKGSADAAQMASADWNIVEPRYFATLRMAIFAGRDFTAADARGAEPVAIVGEGVVRRFWPGTRIADAVGRHLLQRSFDPHRKAASTRTLRIVGVARDPTYGTLLEGTTSLYVYVPLQQQYLRGTPMIVARSRDGRRLAEDLRIAVAAMNPNLPIVSSRSGDDYTSLGVLPQRIVAAVAAGLGGVGLLLAAIGVYGLTAFAVARRTREFGVRIALGATSGDIVGMVLRQGMGITTAGAAIGLLLAAAAGNAATAYLFGLPPMDPVTFVATAVLFAVVGLAACYAPARRATRVNPIACLRSE